MKLFNYLFLLFSFSLLAEEELAVPFSSLERGVSTLAGGCVNVVTGDYVECSQDVCLPAPTPLTLDRFYTSDRVISTMRYGWKLNHESGIKFEEKKAHFLDKSRGTLKFTGDELKFSRDNIDKGYTNCLSGIISGRTNAKAIKIDKGSGGRAGITMPSGNLQTFHQNKESFYQLMKDQLANGKNSYHYIYDQKNHLQYIQLKNKKNKLLSWIFIHRAHRRDEAGNPFFDLCTIDGRYVRYQLHEFKERTDREREILELPHYYHIEEVRSSTAPAIHYTYTPKGNSEIDFLISSRTLPEGRGKKISYYQPEEGEQANRVKCVSEPSGPEQEYVPTYKFVYQKGMSFVMDGLCHLKSYAIDDCKRLRSIFYYEGKHLIVSGIDPIAYAERFVWNDAGDLICQRIDERNLRTKVARVYRYDQDGNVVQEENYGNFSGKSAPIEIGEDGLPLQNGSECYRKRSIYQTNLLVEATEDNGSSVRYSYYPGSDLVAEKVVNGTIYYRYKYDEDAVMTRMSVEEPGKEKRILYFHPRREYPFGLPERVEEKYVERGKERLLKRVDKSYSLLGHLVQEDHYDSNDAYCYSLKWEYDAHGNVLREQNALGEWIERGYDQNDNLIYQKSGSCTKRWTYDLMNRVTAEEVSWGDQSVAARHKYDVMGNKTASTDIYGNRTEYKYDEFGHVIEIRHPDEHRTLMEYDIFGNVIALKDQRGNTTRTRYNTFGKPVRIEYPDGTTEAFEYNLDGTLKCATAKSGLVTHYKYDLFGRVTKESNSYGSQTSTYDAFHLTSRTDPMGVTTYYSYDGAGRLIQEKRAERVVSYEYDALGRLHRTKDAYTVSVKEYDFLDRVIEERVEDLEGNVCTRVEYGYDVDGNPVMEKRGDSITLTEYDPFGNKVKLTDPLGNITTIRNDYKHHKSVETDPLGNQTIIIYNSLGKESEIVKRSGKGEVLSQRQNDYNGCGHLIKTVETVITPGQPSRSVEIKRTYNEMGQLLTQTEAGVKTTHYAYDGEGRLSVITKPDGAEIFHEYDEKGRLVHHYSVDFDYSYEYDRNDRLTRAGKTVRKYDVHGMMIEETLENGLSLRYRYDQAGRLNRLTLPDETMISYGYAGPFLKSVRRGGYEHIYEAYDRAGNLLKAALAGSGGTVEYRYDLAYRLSDVEHEKWGQKNTYDAVGNVMEYTLRDMHGDYAVRLRYDNLYQLKRENETTYQHDSVHNRVKKNDNEYSVNDLNQLVAQSDTRYEYDLNGNLVKEVGPGGTVNYRYDALDRLIKVKRKGMECNYTYDAFSRRMTKERDGEVEEYLYQMNQEIGVYKGELRILGKGRGAEIGAAVAIEQGGELLVPVHNPSGSIAALIDGRSGECIEAHRYQAFGEVGGLSRIPWGFLSKRCDPETGFVYFGMRYYMPELGRWLNPDPEGFADGPNLYAFIKNNPRFIDLFGLNAADLNYYREVSLAQIDSGEFTCDQFMEHFDYRRSCILSLGRKEFPSRSMITFTNGVNTSFPDMVKHMMELSNLFKGYNVWGVYVPTTYNIFTDLSLSLAEKCGAMSTEVIETQRLWTNFLKTRPSNANLYTFSHSRGSIVTNNAIEYFPYKNEIYDRMWIWTFGFAQCVEKRHAKNVMNYASSADPVSWIGITTSETNFDFEKYRTISRFEPIYDANGRPSRVAYMIGPSVACYIPSPITIIQRDQSELWFGDHAFSSKTLLPTKLEIAAEILLREGVSR